MMRTLRVLPVFSVLLLALTLVVPGCGGSDADSSSFSATVAGPRGESGKLTVAIDVQAAALSLPANDAAGPGALPANGSILFVTGNSVALAGTFAPAAGELALSGGGYGVACTVADGDLNGTYSGPGGSSGLVAGCDASVGDVRVFCGTYTGTRTIAPHDVSGVFNIVIAPDGHITGLGADDMGKGSRVTGTLKGTAISGSTSSGTAISGSLNGNTVSGTFSEPQSSGTWSGTRI